MSELLRVDGLTNVFGGLVAVKDVNFSVKKGEILGLIGPNGAGKTTTFNMLVGLAKPTTGRIVFDGQEVQGLAPHSIAKLGMTKTFQTIALFEDLSLVENVMVGALLRTNSVREARVAARNALILAGMRDPQQQNMWGFAAGVRHLRHRHLLLL